MKAFSYSALIVAAVALVACGSSSEKKSAASSGKRISVLEAAHKPVADAGITDFTVEVPEPALIKDWAQNGGTTEHAIANSSLRPVVEKEWSTSIGTGSGGNFKLLSSPVVSDGVVYAMDARGRVSAYNETNGDRLWRAETLPQDADDDTIGGGIAVQGRVVYATTGFGEVIALRGQDGAVIWRRSVGKPLRSAPTVAEGRVYVISIENDTLALEASSGRVMWKHSGIAESATLMGASSPAVHGDTVVVAYSSGELFGLRAQNGRVVWGEVLSVPTQVGALPAIADIRGLPVMSQGRVYAVSHSGRMVSLDERTGDRAWEADIGGVNTPLVIENTVYVVTLNNELVAMTRHGGRVIWSVDLQKTKDPSDRDSKPVLWWGPVMAGGRLWLSNSIGHLVAYSPDRGAPLFDRDVGDSFFLPPIVANSALYMIEDSGKLIALK